MATTGDAECGAKPTTFRSPTVLSAKSALSAYAEIELQPLSHKGYCAARWTVSVRKAGSPSWERLSFRTEEGQGWGFDLEILGFEQSQSVLILRLSRWAGDYTEHEIVFADAAKRNLRRVKLNHMLTRKERTADCPIWLAPIGIQEGGRIIVDAGSAEDLNPGQRPCFSDSRWTFDPRHGTRKLTPEARPLKLDGTVAP